MSRHWLRLLACLIALGLGAPALVTAQGLGAAAARERQKRQQQAAPAPAKVFTDADLAKEEKPTDETPPDADKAKPEPKPGAADPLERERQERKLLEAEWRVRFANAREQVSLAEANCWREVVRTEYYQGIPVQMKVKEFVESEELRQAKQALANLEEEFRRTGLPPGWVREP